MEIILEENKGVRLVKLTIRRFPIYEVRKRYRCWLFWSKWKPMVFGKGDWGKSDKGQDWFSDFEIAKQCYHEAVQGCR